MKTLFFLRLKNFFSVEKYALLKLALLFLILYYSVWHCAGAGSFIRKKLYGEEQLADSVLQNDELIEDYHDFSAGEPVEVKGHIIYKFARKKYSIGGILAAHKDNKDFIKYNLANYSDEDKKVYMDISPENLSVVWGRSPTVALIKCDFEQGESLYAKCQKDLKEEDAHVNNYHIIPANKAIEKAVSILPASSDKDIYLEGFLIDWDNIKPNKADDFRFKTALYSGQTVSHDREDEVKIRKNFQLYLTRIIYDGYEFK